MVSAKKSKKAPDTLIRVSRQGNTYQQKTYQHTERAYGSTQEASEEYEEVIIDRSAAEIIDQINARVKSPYYSIYWGIATLLLLPFTISYIAPPLILGYLTYRAYKADIRRKTTPLFYEFSDDYSEKKFHDSIEALSKLAMTENLWRLKSKIAVGDWKRNAGSNSALIRQRAKIGKQTPTLIKTNIEVWGVDAGNIKIYLLPDRFFAFQDGVYSAIFYDDIQVSIQDLEYVEQERLPRDAMVIGQTWKYVRRDGGADRRFNNNRQLPVVKYGVVAFSSQNFIAYLIISSLQVASSFTQSFSQILAPSTPLTFRTEPLPTSDKQFQPTLPEVNLFPEHLEPLEQAASQGLELTTSEIARLLGVSSSFITKNPISFDYEGFRFVRSGRSGRQISWKVKYIGNIS
ncbi:MAG: hypothetical protein WBG73_03845 [Coleofasciculaceae cyanobacterium]